MTQVQQISPNKQNNNNKYLLAGLGGSFAIGSLHGVYKKVNQEQISTIEAASSFHNNFIMDKPKVRIRMAQLKPTGHDGAFSIISSFPPRKGPAVAKKVLIDNMVNLEDSFKYQNEWMILLQKGLMKLGFKSFTFIPEDLLTCYNEIICFNIAYDKNTKNDRQ